MAAWVLPAIMAGASVLGGLMGKSGSDDATKDATKLQKKMWKRSLKYLKPFRKFGEKEGIGGLEQFLSRPGGVSGGRESLIDELRGLSSGFKFDPDDPAYKFRMGEAQKQLDQFSASRGNYNSRAAMNALLKSGMQLSGEESEKQYGRQYGSIMDQFNMRGGVSDEMYNKLMGIAGMGQSAATGSANISQATGQQIGSNYMQQAQGERDLWSGLGAAPLNFMLLQNLFKKPASGPMSTALASRPTAGYGASLMG